MDANVFIRARSFLGKVWNLATPYWRSEEKWTAWGLLAAIVAISLGLVYLLVLLNDWQRDFFNAIQEKQSEDFFALLLYFSFLAAVFIVASIYRLYLQQMLEMRWRIWLSRQYLGDWLGEQVFYRLELTGRGTDNPDQRIAEDLRLFTSNTLSLGLGLLREIVTLVSFVVILWNVSGPLSFELGGSTVTIPGYMVWAALAYAVVGSVVTHYVGRPLIGLNFQQERLEADFRFGLVRLREHAEGIALYRGEAPEQRSLLEKLERVRENWWALMLYTKRLGAFTIGYNQIAVIFPYFVAGPRYLAGAITLGELTQIANAFGQVQSSLSWFVDSYGQLANWKASVDRLITFHQALQDAHAEVREQRGIRRETDPGNELRADRLDLALPTGRLVLADESFTLRGGERVLVTGPSGSGKSTLFRALAGIWPFGRGQVRIPAGARLLFLPQKPYIPIASLRDAVSFPEVAGSFTDAEVGSALAAVGLASLSSRLDELQNWNLRLSGGEQQKLALARALLIRPDWLFLDEATSALDDASEQRAYSVLESMLPGTAIVSIAHHPGVAGFHGRHLAFRPEGERMRLAAG
ncbi:MAG: ABC transporter ATP-binding protein/permease [Burkholderiales bacterium]|jgi:putative ATP-binding cassette transporter|nr:ABC transporter ATP-binding protein/permease [Burkholderiales bacterium]